MLLAATEPSLVETVTAWSTLAAAVATGLSVIFIARQIALTRKSVEATEATLTIARDEFQHGQLLRVDAQRAAIDAEMPRITVEVAQQSSSVWRDDVRVATFGDEEQATEVETGFEFTMPRDGAVPLMVGLQISISNDGPRRARIRIDTHGGEEIVIGAGETTFKWVNREQPLSDWVAIAKARQSGEVGEERTVLGFSYIYPGDVGATERHVVLQGGTIVEPSPDNEGGWRIKQFGPSDREPFGSLNAVPQPFVRTYWASRLESRPLIAAHEAKDR